MYKVENIEINLKFNYQFVNEIHMIAFIINLIYLAYHHYFTLTFIPNYLHYFILLLIIKVISIINLLAFIQLTLHLQCFQFHLHYLIFQSFIDLIMLLVMLNQSHRSYHCLKD
jgi:hypothetical protein